MSQVGNLRSVAFVERFARRHALPTASRRYVGMMLSPSVNFVFFPRESPNATAPQVDEVHRDLRRKIERYLDRGMGACYLRRPDLAGMVAEALQYFHGDHYLLDDWTVMPNHVHLMIWPMPNFTLSEILKSRKRQTSRQANLMLGKTGKTFWQRESYDHWIRNDDEKARIRRYIRMNPVKAGLCATPEDWQWSSAWPGWKRR